MVSPVPPGVRTDLIAFFSSKSGQAVGPNTNARHACGYDSNLAGWRGLSGGINLLPHILGNSLRLDPTDMDGVLTVAHVEIRLRKFRQFADAEGFLVARYADKKPARKPAAAKKPAKRKPSRGQRT
jgi:hypothetical protein